MTNQAPTFYAFLIGINFYFPHDLPDGRYKNLRGCVRDINHVETYLKETFNLTPDRIIKLKFPPGKNLKLSHCATSKYFRVARAWVQSLKRICSGGFIRSSV